MRANANGMLREENQTTAYPGLGSSLRCEDYLFRDSLTGTIVRSDGKKLVIKSEYAGDVTLDWTAIQQITSDQSLHAGLANGKTTSAR